MVVEKRKSAPAGALCSLLFFRIAFRNRQLRHTLQKFILLVYSHLTKKPWLSLLTGIFHSSSRETVQQSSFQKNLCDPVYRPRKFAADRPASAAQDFGGFVLSVVLENDGGHELLGKCVQLVERAFDIVNEDQRILEARHPVGRDFGAKQLTAQKRGSLPTSIEIRR